MKHESASQILADDQRQLLESAIEGRLAMTYEERIEAHENARQLLNDLQAAGKKARAESESSS